MGPRIQARRALPSTVRNRGRRRWPFVRRLRERRQYRPASLTGWALLALSVALLTWRLQVDYRLRMHPTPSHPLGTAVLAHLSTSTTPIVRATSTPAATPDPTGALPIAGVPTLDARLVDGILAAYGSPLRGHGVEIAAVSARYRIDDAVALAFFVMESRAGTLGEAVRTRSFGNLRPMPRQPSIDGYRAYATWMDGAAEWFRVMRALYLDRLHLATVEAAMPIYAPASDTNTPATIIAGIRQLVSCWRGELASCPDDPPSVPALIAARSDRH